MNLTTTALLLKWGAAWIVLSLFGMTMAAAPTPGQAAVLAALLALLSWVGDRTLPFAMQGITRWLADSLLAAVTLYVAWLLWPAVNMPFARSLLAGLVIGSVEIPLHFYLAARFGLRGNRDGGRAD